MAVGWGIVSFLENVTVSVLSMIEWMCMTYTHVQADDTNWTQKKKKKRRGFNDEGKCIGMIWMEQSREFSMGMIKIHCMYIWMCQRINL